MPFSGRRHGKASYRVVVAHLEPGEYAMTIEGSRDVFNMFGVDK
jgi:hypothetical protein